MQIEYHEYTVKKIVNVHKHVDGPWFWDKYSAHPYVGCRSGCEFCYLRGDPYLGKRNPDGFDTLIQIKTNAVQLLRKELSRLPVDVITAGDWQQPAEDRYLSSRRMLEVILELRFPLLIIERSPLLIRDADLLMEINRETWAGVVFSISSLDPNLKQAFEPRSPGIQRRLAAMAKLAEAGITVGTSLMPILPIVGDDEDHLEAVIQATRDHGGQFVLAGGLSMNGTQAKRTLAAAARLDPHLEALFRKLYHWEPDTNPNYSPPQEYNRRLGCIVRDLCSKHGLPHRMRRPIQPGDLAINKRIAERLFLRTYDLELEGAADHLIWTYRRAAWLVDELQENIVDLFDRKGEPGLLSLPGIGKSLAAQIVRWIHEVAKDHLKKST